MLKNGHELNCVVAKFLDARQNILGKFFVRPNTSFGGGDSDVSFIDFCACWFRRWRILKFVYFRCRGIPESGIVDRRYSQVLCDSLYPSGKTFNPFSSRNDHRNLFKMS